MKTSTILLSPYGLAYYHFVMQLSDGSWAVKCGKTPSRWNVLDGTAVAWDLGVPQDILYIKDYYNTESVYFAVGR